MGGIRIQKYLSQKGICSRREAERYILRGWVSVNSEVVTQLGTVVDPLTDSITISSELTEAQQQKTYLLFNKPKGIVTNCPKPGETEIKALLPERYNGLHAIGRLDKDSEGLILLSDDGIFAKKILTDQRYHERTYLVGLQTPFQYGVKNKLENGIMLFGAKTRPVQIQVINPHLIQIILTEGKNRQIRRMIRKVGNQVTTLKRIQFGGIELGDLKPGKFWLLTRDEIYKRFI